MMKPALIASAIILAPSALTPSAMAQQADHSAHEGHEMPQATPQQAPPAHDHSQHVDPQKPADEHADHDMSQMDHSAHGAMADHAMTGALGSYPMSREGSGTSWLPDDSEHGGLHAAFGEWMLMGHARLDGVYSAQDGPRGDEKAFIAGMFMGTATRAFDNGDTLQFRAMASPDPFMGKRGYPLLLASGETADGIDHLVDRQHPHDLFMELSASYSKKLTASDSVFVYAGLPGEPAFGPPAFMHRPASEASPEAPITHHWMDSTHITYGVLTGGWVHDDLKLEVSRFRGREPDQDRYDIETGELDSTAARVSWNPTRNWSLQASWADVTSPEQLEPDVDVTKYSVSALYTQKLAGGGMIAFTGAWARKNTSENVSLDAWLAEASWKPNEDWTIFSRGEAIETDELNPAPVAPIDHVSKLSIGAVRDFRLRENLILGVGALFTVNGVSNTLSTLYGGDPNGAMAFVRLKVG
jgi:hypothetical protein